MAVLEMLGAVVLIHAALLFTDQFLKSCLNIPYLCFLENLGITVKPFQLHCFTTAFNRSIAKWGVWKPRLCKFWFTIGVVMVICMIVPSILLLTSSLVNFFLPSDKKTTQALQAVVPGINLPVAELPYYFFTLLVASFIHEIGHAWAAVKDDIHIRGFGFMIFFIFPGVYVDISTDELKSLPPFRQLKILCAGVWHNVVLVVIALLIGLATPVVFQPLYSHGNGIAVLTTTEDSPARGPTGLQVSDVITSINRCPVNNFDDWRQCLVYFVRADQTGFCVPESVVNIHDETIQNAYESSDGSVQCCAKESSSHLCFELLHNHDDDAIALMHSFSCLPARIAISKSTATCTAMDTCPENSHCLAPSLRNTSRLLQVVRRGGGGADDIKPDMLYLGPPSALYHTVSLTNYVPRFSFLPSHWPNKVEIVCDYFVKFSGALAVLNVVPVFYLDGYWIMGAIIDLFWPSWDSVTKRIVLVLASLMGSLLLIANIAVGIWSLI